LGNSCESETDVVNVSVGGDKEGWYNGSVTQFFDIFSFFGCPFVTLVYFFILYSFVHFLPWRKPFLVDKFKTQLNPTLILRFLE